MLESEQNVVKIGLAVIYLLDMGIIQVASSLILPLEDNSNIYLWVNPIYFRRRTNWILKKQCYTSPVISDALLTVWTCWKCFVSHGKRVSRVKKKSVNDTINRTELNWTNFVFSEKTYRSWSEGLRLRIRQIKAKYTLTQSAFSKLTNVLLSLLSQII